MGLVREFLDFFHLDYTKSVLEPESGTVSRILSGCNSWSDQV